MSRKGGTGGGWQVHPWGASLLLSIGIEKVSHQHYRGYSVLEMGDTIPRLLIPPIPILPHAVSILGSLQLRYNT